MSITVDSYRKKPVEIQAMQFTEETARALIEWAEIPESHVFPAGEDLATGAPVDGYVVIATLEGDMRANLGDWVIRGIKGEFYPCRDDIFRATYDAVTA
ncbi:hypothetical protein [Nocardia sp. NPDC057440]|uniref:hypothetical protein n=1 Tax=Nocardia sp. NPDC057440 TaxID=3346134 RepID=UPI00366E7019